MKKFLFTIIFFSAAFLSAQTDTLITNNGQILTGKLKKLSQSVAVLKTSYSKKDFEIKWKKIKAFYSPRFFTITLSDRMRILGRLRGTRDSLVIITKYNNRIVTTLEHVIQLDEFNDQFFKRFSATFSVGLNITKANDLRQFTMRSTLGYFTKDWRSFGSFDMVFNEQQATDITKRIDATVSYTYFLRYQWFLFGSSDFLQNDEQKLKLRSTPRVGFGNNVYQSARAYLSVAGGIAFNIETYTDPQIAERNNTEVFVSSELNMYDLGDLNLLTIITLYKSLATKERMRTDLKIDVKYDFPFDIFIKLGYTLNYDTQPVEGASKSDYVIQTTFGWEFN